MKIRYEVLGRELPLDCRQYVPITYCLNCEEPIRNEAQEHKEYCDINCENEHREIMELTLEGSIPNNPNSL